VEDNKYTQRGIEDTLEKIESKLEVIDSKLEGTNEALHTIDKILVKQESNLAMHMKRSDLLEASQGTLERAIIPILKVYTVAWGVCKVIGALSVVVGILVGISKLLNIIT
jgi:hypothetical protein